MKRNIPWASYTLAFVLALGFGSVVGAIQEKTTNGKAVSVTGYLQTRRASPLEEQVVMMSRSDQSAELKLVVTNTLIVTDIQRSVAFYRDVLGATRATRGRADVSAAREHLAYYQRRRRPDRRQA